MNSYIEMILRDKKETEQKMEAAMAPYRKKLQEADEALKKLGYKDGSFVINTKTMADLDKLTIKQRVTKALTEQYPDGAHYSDILTYINENWPHLPVKRTSLSPQLTRLRRRHVIRLDEDKSIWHLVANQEATNESTPALAGVDNSVGALFDNPSTGSGG